MRGNIKPFDNTKQYIQATKRQGQVSVLPELDGSKLINLPTVQSSSKLNYLLFRIPKIENDTEYYNFNIQFSNDGYFSNVIEINTFDNIALFSIFTEGALMPLGEIYVSSSSGDDVNIVDNTKISVDVSEQILQLNIKDIKDFNRDYKYFRFQWIDKNQEGGKIGYGNLQAGGIQIFDIQFQVEISQKSNNVLKIEDDGLFVDGSQFGSQVKISENENNILTEDDAGALYVPAPEQVEIKVRDENPLKKDADNTLYVDPDQIYNPNNKNVLDKFSYTEGKLYFDNQSLSTFIQEPNPDFKFNSTDIINGQLTLDNINPIADILFNIDKDGNQKQVVHLPILIEGNFTKISFENINLQDYQYGGVVRFAKGVSVNKETIYNTTSSQVNKNGISIYNGDIYNIIVNEELQIDSESIVLNEGQIIKIFIDNNTEYNTYINDDLIGNKSFFCSFINLNGTIRFFVSIVELK